MRRNFLIAIAVLGVGATLWFLTPARLQNADVAVVVPDDIDAWLTQQEHAAHELWGVVPGAEKRVRWQQEGQRTPLAIVSLHGFSATRQELAPLPERIADALGANLYETRLAGHGRVSQAMHEVRAEDWLSDASEALAIGAAIGDEVIVLGASTGGTLALAMLQTPAMERVRSIILFSPNIAPIDPSAQWLTRPGGPLLARLIAGESQSWEPANDQQAIYWSTSYPTAAVVEVMRLTDLAEIKLEQAIDQSVLIVMSPRDGVVSPTAIVDAYARMETARKDLIEFHDSEDPKEHILAGDIMSPGTTDVVAAIVLDFLTAD